MRTCLPSSQYVFTVVIKNCEPLVSGPAVIDKIYNENIIICINNNNHNNHNNNNSNISIKIYTSIIISAYQN